LLPHHRVEGRLPFDGHVSRQLVTVRETRGMVQYGGTRPFEFLIVKHGLIDDDLSQSRLTLIKPIPTDT
jgi:hypothetical protein